MASEVDCSSDKIAPSAQFSVDILLAFLKLDFRALQFDVKIFQKTSPKSTQKRVQANSSLYMGTFEVLSDFQDFLKINLEIMQCQEAPVPVLLLFSKSTKIILRLLSRWIVRIS